MGKFHNMRVLIAGVERVLRVLRKNGYSGVAVTQGVQVNNVQAMV
jgi:acetolactate synthase regulatory subunit